MIKDENTNVVYLSDMLKERFPDFCRRFISLLDEMNINWKLIPGTRDIWARDYMPVQIDEGCFLQYLYEPDYLLNDKYRHTITDTSAVCKAMNMACRVENVKIDGGNVSICGDYIVMTDKVFTENGKEKNDASFKQMLESIFGKKIIISFH